MSNVPSVRLTIPKAAIGEVARKGLIDIVLNSQKKIVYIHGGAGYGKTTLLAQIASSEKNTVWLSLAGENDIFSFIDILCDAVRQVFSEYQFNVSEYLPFIEKDNFITIIANALISSIEKIPDNFLIIIDDLHTIGNTEIRELIAFIMKYTPKNITLCIGSREVPWQELIPLQIKGSILEITQTDLALTQKETAQILGIDNVNVYNITEGWALAISSFRVLLENGVSIDSLLSHNNEALYSYLLYECIRQLTPETIDFLKTSAYFEELDTDMLNFVLNRENSKSLLENLVLHNMFTIKTSSGHYRYHSLFRECLLETQDPSKQQLLYTKAAKYYLNEKQYSKAAEYAIRLDNKEILENIILASYRGFMKVGKYSELRVWFQVLDNSIISNSKVLLAKGSFLSSIGNFTGAKKCLDSVIPLLKDDDSELYIEAMVHKARVLRNFSSFEDSNELLDELIAKLDNLTSETSYSVVIEKLYNLCWNSQINEAYSIAYQMIESCARAGNIKVKAWYERYLSAIHFFSGRMRETVYYYEKSLTIPEDELQYLDMHNIGIFAAKAYQMLGDRKRSLSILSSELQKIRNTGKYDEIWAGYLLAAEIHYENVFIDRMNGGIQTYETTLKYFTLADEYAPLYRRTKLQVQWAKLMRLTYSLTYGDNVKEDVVNTIFQNLDEAGDYIKTIVMARLFGYYAAVSDFPNAVKCARLCIEIGEKSNIMLLPTLAYGILARAAIAMKNHPESVKLTKRYLSLCYNNGVLEYFKMRNAYDPILEFAFDNNIEPEITKQIINFVGYNPKKAYIETLGEFAVFPYNDRTKPLKMRTKKERELLAFLINSGNHGATKEQIYQAIWSESESSDIKKLIGVNFAHIKKDLAVLGIESPIINHEKHYSVCMDEIELDTDLYEKAIKELKHQNNSEAARKVISLYKGEYLSDFEALWAIDKRFEYSRAYDEAKNLLITT